MASDTDFIIIFGPAAVGKMTVGKKLADGLGYKLFHNHISIEFVRPYFDFGDEPFWSVVTKIRKTIMTSLAENKLSTIFTFIWVLDDPNEKKYMDGYIKLFEKNGFTTYFIELEATQKERLRRNRMPDRLAEKASKRNVKLSEKILLDDEKYKMNSNGDFYYLDRYLKINSSSLTIEETVDQIMSHFEFKSKEERNLE